MIVGSAIVFSTVVFMNRKAPKPEDTSISAAIDFTVQAPTAKPEERETPLQQRRSTAKSDPPALAPLPNLEGVLSSIRVEMPDFNSESIGTSESLFGDLDNVTMTDDSVDEKPVVLASPITYPTQARQRKIEGRIVVSLLIGTDGTVKRARILESAPPELFDRAVLDALPRWRFEPARYKNKNVQVWVTLPLDFRLE
jgi:periplasmic protein TonB